MSANSAWRPAPYLHNLAGLAARASAHDSPVILHSAGEPSARSRWSIAALAPIQTIKATASDNQTQPNPDTFKREIASALALFAPLPYLPDPLADLPFTGGLIGAIAYEYGAHFERMPRSPEPLGMPALSLAAYPAFYAADHLRREAWIIGRSLLGESLSAAEARMEHIAEWVAKSEDILPLPPNPAPYPNPRDWRDDWQPSLDRAAYTRAANRILDYLRAGDVYQVNLTVRHRRPFEGDPARLFRALTETNPSPYMAWLQSPQADCPPISILSSSPELLLDLDRNGRIETRPIKGTIRRAAEGGTADADLADALLASAKDRAEHTMIVDLERNDLGRVCVAGSVAADPFMAIESYRGLHHLVSSVHGRLRPGLGPADALAALFPGGSITGAPKVRAMEIIGELEPHARGIYTGAIGWITPEGAARFNLAIRTLVHRADTLDLFVGGGIVADSDPDLEYEECRLKGAAMAAAVKFSPQLTF